MRSPAFGTYLSRRSPLHELDARVKLALLLGATITLFANSSPTVLVAGLAILAVLVRLSGMGPAMVMRAVRPAALVMVLVVIFNMFRFDGTADIFLLGSFGISGMGLIRGVVAVLRIGVLIGFALIVSATTTATELADAVGWGLRPLGKLGLPVDDIAMVLSITLRFIPVCAEEFDRVLCAQRARGVDFSAGTMREQLSRWASVLIPVIVALFSHADSVADAMRERAYGAGVRTNMRKKIGYIDIVVLIGGLALCTLVVLSGLGVL